MHILSIGSDRKLFEEGSVVRARQEAYAGILGTTDIIVFSRPHRDKISFGNVTVYPTNSRSRFWYGWGALRIARRLQKPDVVTTQDPFETGLVALFIARSLKVPLHVQVHTDFTSHGFTQHSFTNWFRAKIAWFVLKRAAHVRTILERTAEDIRSRGVSSVSVLPIYVDADAYAKTPRIKHPHWKIALLCVGRLEKEKRFEIAIDALALARSKGHDVGLTIVGEGRERSRYYRHAQRLRVADRVEIVGWQNNLAQYYAQADIVLVPSRYEGYGLVIVEALASGVPVLSTDVGVAREAGALVVNAKEFPEALVKWVENGPRQGSLAMRPYANLEDYVKKYCDDIQLAKR